jgi:nucleotide-binding universal stress UspA family protein
MTRGLSRMLVATDFGAASDRALEYAITLALQLGASVHLLHVFEDPFVSGAWVPELYVAGVPTMRATLIDGAARRLAALRLGVERAGVVVTSEVTIGSPGAAIREVAEARGIDLVVMGTHGRCGIARVLLGSVTEKVVRQAPCPVLTVQASAAPSAKEEYGIFAPSWLPAD